MRYFNTILIGKEKNTLFMDIILKSSIKSYEIENITI